MLDAVKWRTFLILLVIRFGGAEVARGDVKLAGIFGPHMVLQRDKKTSVWGWADAGESVHVAVGANFVDAKAESDGSWRVEIDPLKASGQPVKFVVTGASAAGKNDTISLDDVLVGDVWLASGQSNMQYSLKGVANAVDALAHADEPEIRLCAIGNTTALEPVKDHGARWALCTAKSASSFSAVAYFFAKDLHADLKVPIGVIGAYVAGTPAQSWTNVEALKSAPELGHYVEAISEARQAASTRPDAKVGAGVPSSLYNGMIAPLEPIALKGVIWYQGESNTGQAVEYRTLFPALINGWRAQWGVADTPFLFVQLPGFGRRSDEIGASNWAMLREAQGMALKLPHTGMAVTIDLSAPRQILHPKNKANVGGRLALAARHLVYAEDVAAEGPKYRKMKIEGHVARIEFDNAEDGLVLGAAPTENGSAAATRPSNLTGFLIAGADRKIVRAEAKIVGDDAVEVWSDQVMDPAAVRYGWEDNPAVDLYNGAGLPAGPFRTDDWER
jgi:sialate O-acetylesterase